MTDSVHFKQHSKTLSTDSWPTFICPKPRRRLADHIPRRILDLVHSPNQVRRSRAVGEFHPVVVSVLYPAVQEFVADLLALEWGGGGRRGRFLRKRV